MPSSLQGFGTGFVGQRDFWPDGSYVTTEWYIFFFVPLIPIRSVRVKAGPLRTNYLYVIGSMHRDYVICDEQPVNAKQVACVYSFLAFFAVWIFLAGFGSNIMAALIGRLIPRLQDGRIALPIWVLLLAVPWSIPWYLRERGRRWRPGFK